MKVYVIEHPDLGQFYTGAADLKRTWSAHQVDARPFTSEADALQFVTDAFAGKARVLPMIIPAIGAAVGPAK